MCNRFLILIGIAFSLFGCLKKENYPSAPYIEFVSYSKGEINYDTIGNNLDSIDITLKFTDGEGDLGVSNEGSEDSCDFCSKDTLNPNSCYNSKTKEVFILDNRDSCFSESVRNLPFIPDADGGALSGIIKLKIYSPPLVSKKTYPYIQKDTVRYSIWIKDRARNRSNIIRLPPLSIKPV